MEIPWAIWNSISRTADPISVRASSSVLPFSAVRMAAISSARSFSTATARDKYSARLVHAHVGPRWERRVCRFNGLFGVGSWCLGATLRLRVLGRLD